MAHNRAKHVRIVIILLVWMEDVPSCLHDVLVADYD